jgi:hypothetical protein
MKKGKKKEPSKVADDVIDQLVVISIASENLAKKVLFLKKDLKGQGNG